MKQLLFRADDLGYSEAVNYGIQKSVKEGIVCNVGVMMNMDATLHGVNLLKEEVIAFGQHTNISAGYPLSDPQKIPSLLKENGQFKTSKDYASQENDVVVFEEVLLEIKAQYDEFLTLFGKKPDYIDGHAVASANFFKAIEYFSKEKGIRYFTLPTKNSEGLAIAYVNQAAIYSTMEFMTSSYDPMVTFKRLATSDVKADVAMMVVHPGYLDDYIINNSSLLTARTKEVAMLTSKELKEFIVNHEIKLINIKEL